jgi:hypothetical protein
LNSAEPHQCAFTHTISQFVCPPYLKDPSVIYKSVLTITFARAIERTVNVLSNCQIALTPCNSRRK